MKCCPRGSACNSCRPEIFHTPPDHKPIDMWWDRWTNFDELVVVIEKCNDLYRKGEPVISDSQYDFMIKRAKDMNKDYEEPL